MHIIYVCVSVCGMYHKVCVCVLFLQCHMLNYTSNRFNKLVKPVSHYIFFLEWPKNKSKTSGHDMRNLKNVCPIDVAGHT